ncbi:MAG TPA: amidohydrolase family protein [Longimicrobium sp.]|uniref:amidohydrolase family protein n=1 Tax=Longimicrobium sp. TaxID=2029185 RepID=UPI002EDA2305
MAIVDVTLIDGQSDTVAPHQTVIVRGGRIEAVGPAGDARIPRGARRVDGRGRWLIPGLWDMHVHAFANGFADFSAPLMLAWGVTGARDMGFYVDSARFWRDEVAAGRVQGPRMVIGGRLDGPVNRAPWVARAADEAQARHAVDSLANAGADFIKVYSNLGRSAYFGAADQARRRGIPFAGHVPYPVSMREAIRAGQASVEHQDDLMRACSADDDALRSELAGARADRSPQAAMATVRDHGRRMRAGYDAARCNAVLAAMARAGTRLTPTLVVYQPYVDRTDTTVTHPSALAWVSPGLRRAWDRRMGPATPDDSAVVRGYFSLQRTGEARRMGVRVMAGTDAPLPYVIPGLALHDELALLVRSGFTPMQALRAATYEPAAYLGALDTLGTLRPGRVADMVLLDADPLADIRNTRRIHTVIARGRVVDRAALLARVRRGASGPGR